MFPSALTVVGSENRFTRNIRELVEIMKIMSIKASASVLEDCQSGLPPQTGQL